MDKQHEQRGAWINDGEQVAEVDRVTQLLDHLYTEGPTKVATDQALQRVKNALGEGSVKRLYYDVIPDTPVGPLYVAMSEQGITMLAFDDDEIEFLDRLGRREKTPIERSGDRLETVTRQLREYFAGERAAFDLPLDLRALTPFQKSVLSAISQVPAGETTSYGGLAQRIGKPGAARAVGRALGSNPIPIIIPCHRALAADGSLGGYSGRGGVRTKQVLLTLEGAWG